MIFLVGKLSRPDAGRDWATVCGDGGQDEHGEFVSTFGANSFENDIAVGRLLANGIPMRGLPPLCPGQDRFTTSPVAPIPIRSIRNVLIHLNLKTLFFSWEIYDRYTMTTIVE